MDCMYGKHFESLYEGSMIGAGAMVFAVWGYVIGKMKPDGKVGMQVRLNPKLLGPILGESPEEVEKAIDYLCQPDKHSTSKAEGGRRLVRLGEFDYRVVNGLKYRSIRNEEERREQNRSAQERFRLRQRAFEDLSESEKEILAAALLKEKKRRTVNGKVYSADLKSAGLKAGAQSVIKEGLEQ